MLPKPTKPADIPPSESSFSRAVETLRAAQSIDQQRVELQQFADEADRAFAEARTTFEAARTEYEKRARDLGTLEAEAREARAIVLRESKQSAEELRLDARGRELQKEVASLRLRTGVNAAIVLPPSEQKCVQELAGLEEKITACQADIRRLDNSSPNRWPGHAACEIELRKLLRKREPLAIEAARAEQRYAAWQKIAATIQEAEACFAERDESASKRQRQFLHKALESHKTK